MAVTHSASIVSIPPEHAEGVLPLSVAAGWNQTLADWRFMLAQGEGFGVTAGDRYVASALTLPLGPGLSWISMVLVAPDLRRAGLGTLMLRHCIGKVQAEGKIPGLDATEYGRPLYEMMGFRKLYTLSRWRLARPIKAASPGVRRLTPDDLDAIAAFDAPRSGLQRKPVLAYLAAAGSPFSFVAERDGELSGFVLGRPGRILPQVGPLVAENTGIANALLAAATRSAEALMLDVPDGHDDLRTRLTASGAVRERGFWRMTLGGALDLAEPGQTYAIAGPELA
jgi:GNAT superfamily N-acetyltransferase